ncbi:NAD(P)H-hydrate dehydratase [Rhizobium helianthi]|uniref:Bifunctional NAD(P)H-hydrate repair enzyme n=1 Tax=Rhizobium helianthi TaxID=1132695 RepID=A0ABW4LYN3_9HYPH
MKMSLTDPFLLTPAEAAAADRETDASGIPIFHLMQQAGFAVAAEALRHFAQAERFVVLCGPGNNGGDGFVAASALRRAGANVSIHLAGRPEELTGAARLAWLEAQTPAQSFSSYQPHPGDVIIDAIFGAGLSRDVPPEVTDLITRVREVGCPVLAVDLPSGIDGLTGQVRGAAFQAQRTVTFVARKPGHVLMPGRIYCGEISLAPIGMPTRIARRHARTVSVNDPRAWKAAINVQQGDTHKYKRGHLAVFSGGPSHTGAARMTASAGLCAGAGLVTLASPPDATLVNACAMTAVMVREIADLQDLKMWWASGKISAAVIGPGFGVGEGLRSYVHASAARPMVLDADAITAFAERPDELFALAAGSEPRQILTPHEGEFARLFPDLAADKTIGKLERAKRAAERAHAVIVYKGADTVIAAPDGRLLINENAPAWLATAGSGDVLAGIAGANLAQGIPAFEAAAAAVWLHGEAGNKAGVGMTAEDLIRHIPAALEDLLSWCRL